MKARLPHNFFIYASKFSVSSMIKSVSAISFEIFKNPNSEFGNFGRHKDYMLSINGKRERFRTLLAQTWLIDLIYDLCCLNHDSSIEISENETYHLINLHNDLNNTRDGKRLKNKDDIFLNVYGFFGEQKRFQDNLFFSEFAREKYITDTISEKCFDEHITKTDFQSEFYDITSFSTDEYSALLLIIFAYFSSMRPFSSVSQIPINLSNSLMSTENISLVLNKYSVSLDEIRTSKQKRQILYSKPFIKIDNEYISTNPFLLSCLFTNSNYWIIRNKYCKMKSQQFTNDFGIYFEKYVGEVLENCLHTNEYYKIQEDDTEKRADWFMHIGNFDFIVEQKSCLSILGIKQNQTDVDAMKKYILDTWGEACTQLNATQKSLNLPNAIKIILLYENYYKCECLDELFRLNNQLENDGKYWLVTIHEFEKLLEIYSKHPEIFNVIVAKKNSAEISKAFTGRDLQKFIDEYEISDCDYLKEHRIYEEYTKIRELCFGK